MNWGNAKKSFKDLDELEDQKGGFQMTSSSRERRARRKAEKEAKRWSFCKIICLFYKPFHFFFVMSVKDSNKNFYFKKCIWKKSNSALKSISNIILTTSKMQKDLYVPWEKAWFCPSSHSLQLFAATFSDSSIPSLSLQWLSVLFHICSLTGNKKRRIKFLENM